VVMNRINASPVIRAIIGCPAGIVQGPCIAFTRGG